MSETNDTLPRLSERVTLLESFQRGNNWQAGAESRLRALEEYVDAHRAQTFDVTSVTTEVLLAEISRRLRDDY
jgi:hypothetical protein